MKATLTIVSDQYENIYRIAAEQLKTFLPDWQHYKIKPERCDHLKKDYPYPDKGHFIGAIKPQLILDLLNTNENVLFLGADVVFFRRPFELDALAHHAAVVTPHLFEMKPLDMTRIPNMVSISKTCHLNGDFVLYGQKAAPFLAWQAGVHKTHCIGTNDVFFDQTWLNYMPCFVDDVHWLRHAGYNAAYWRNVQGAFSYQDSIPMINGTPITAFHFSGFVKGEPGKISRHCNYPRATGDFLKFLEWYDKNI